MPIDYSKWKDIEVSDDEDDTHPNIDTPSLFRWRHQARLEKMAERKKEKEEFEQGYMTHQRAMNEMREKLSKASLDQGEREKLVLQLSEMEKQHEEWTRKEKELEKKERLAPWNVDTIGHEGFNKSAVNTRKPAKAEELSEEEREKKMRDFIRAHEKEIKKYSMLHRWDDSKDYLLEHPYLCCEETANYLVIECLNHEMEEKHDLMEHVAHQSVVMQYLLELAKTLDAHAESPSLISSFFTKIKKADKVYMDAFEDELRAFKDRIRKRAHEKVQEAMAEYEEEERKKRLGPGGLDPVEVFETLPPVLQQCFESRDVSKLQDAIQTMSETDARYHIQRCIDSGLWVPSKEDVPGGGETESETHEVNITGGDGEVDNAESELRQRKSVAQ